MTLIKENIDNTRCEYYVRKGTKIKHGISRSWYENDQLWYEYNIVDGKKNGLYREWSEEGQLYSECTYVNDEENGLCRYWYDNGQLRRESTYVNGV